MQVPAIEDVRYRKVSCACLFCRKRGNKQTPGQTPLLSIFQAVSLAKEWAFYEMRLNESESFATNMA